MLRISRRGSASLLEVTGSGEQQDREAGMTGILLGKILGEDYEGKNITNELYL